jgi:hypothetical protein
LTCVVRGTGILIENFELLKLVKLPSSQDTHENQKMPA